MMVLFEMYNIQIDCINRRKTHEDVAYFCSRGQSNDVPAAEGQHYCVDENTERRNHYLDLAGIENYTSRFEG